MLAENGEAEIRTKKTRNIRDGLGERNQRVTIFRKMSKGLILLGKNVEGSGRTSRIDQKKRRRSETGKVTPSRWTGSIEKTFVELGISAWWGGGLSGEGGGLGFEEKNGER